MKHGTGGRVPSLAVIAAVLLIVAVFLFVQNRGLAGALRQERTQATASRQQLDVLAAHAQDARTPDLLLHRFLVTWIVNRAAEATLYMEPSLQPRWRAAFARNHWRPGPKGVTIDHYRLDKQQTVKTGAVYQVTMFGDADERKPAYTMNITVTGHPGSYAVSSLEMEGLPAGPSS